MFDWYFDFLKYVSSLFTNKNGGELELVFSTPLFVTYITIFFIILTYFTIKNLRNMFIVKKHLKLTFINFIKEFILSFFSFGEIYERDYTIGIITIFGAIIFSGLLALLSALVIPALIVLATFVIFVSIVGLVCYFTFIHLNKRTKIK